MELIDADAVAVLPGPVKFVFAISVPLTALTGLYARRRRKVHRRLSPLPREEEEERFFFQR